MESATETAAVEKTGLEVPRVLGDFGTFAPGPVLVCVAGLHGNEPAGVLALQRIFQVLAEESAREWRGRFLGLAGNRQALRMGRRWVEEDLNRIWRSKRVERIRQGGPLRVVEEIELQELDREIRPLLDQDDRPLFVLDIHTTSGAGPAFAVLEDRLSNREFALAFPVPLVLGLEEEVAGTLTNFLSDRGAVAVGFEAGQHQDPESVRRAEAAIWVALRTAGVMPRGYRSRREVTGAQSWLEQELGRLPHVVEVKHRHAIVPGDRFHMAPGFVSFQQVEPGVLMARDRRGEVRAPAGGLLLMPLYQDQGEDGFFLVRPVRRFWLHLSRTMRHLGLERFLHWLPGVHKHPDLPGSFLVDRRVARWYALELFHLLGFRRVGPAERFLRLSRRVYDD